MDRAAIRREMKRIVEDPRDRLVEISHITGDDQGPCLEFKPSLAALGFEIAPFSLIDSFDEATQIDLLVENRLGAIQTQHRHQPFDQGCNTLGLGFDGGQVALLDLRIVGFLEHVGAGIDDRQRRPELM